MKIKISGCNCFSLELLFFISLKLFSVLTEYLEPRILDNLFSEIVFLEFIVAIPLSNETSALITSSRDSIFCFTKF